MSTRSHLVRTVSTLSTLVGLALVTGCAGSVQVAPAAPQRSASADATGVQRDGSMCTVVRRSEGSEVRDARVSERWPFTNYGSASASFAGNVGGRARQTLLSFELPDMPKGAVITKAEVNLHKCVCGGRGVSAHRVTSSWDEHTVTWDSFKGAYDSEPLANLPARDPNRVSFDVTDLAQSWADGTNANDGILLRQDNANTSFSTSESDDASERPYLELCWSVPG